MVCVDLPGRGHSDWLPWPRVISRLDLSRDLVALIARLDVERVDWVGVSLGGLLGMILAAQPETPIRRLVLDDIGGYVGVEALQRIAAFVGTIVFPDRGGLEAFMREIKIGYGPLSEAQWAHLVELGSRRDETTTAAALRSEAGRAVPRGFSEAIAMWPLWRRSHARSWSCAAPSDLLTAETAAEMVARKPGTRLVEFPDVRHAPMLLEDRADRRRTRLAARLTSGLGRPRSIRQQDRQGHLFQNLSRQASFGRRPSELLAGRAHNQQIAAGLRHVGE